MIRGLVVAVGGAALLIAGMTGCSGKNKSEGAPSSTANTGSASVQAGGVSASAGAGTAKVSIDGQPRDMNGQVVCSSMGGNFNIAIGEAGTGVAVVMSPDASKVTSVGLGNVNGVAMATGDAALLDNETSMALNHGDDAEVLVFDLAP